MSTNNNAGEAGTAKCPYEVAWIGRCGKPLPCEIHDSKTCSVCHKPATHECDRTGIQFVCGAPLCNDCEGKETLGAAFGLFGFGGHYHGPKE